MSERVQVWSSGGGTQSAAIAALIVRGDLPKSDLAAIVDTEREASATWEYHNVVIVPALASVGVTLHRIPKSQYATVDLYAGNGDLLIPAFTGTGKLPTFCSDKWKRRVLQRWANEQYPATQFRIWIGISLDESRRVKPEDGKWQNWYPLIEKRMTRRDCVTLVNSMGWPDPPRSSCWMCPNHTVAEWTALQHDYPTDFKRAAQLEDAIREQDDDLWLTRRRVPLRDWTGDDEPDLFTGLCDSGYCFV
jgi:hypothetical protein